MTRNSFGQTVCHHCDNVLDEMHDDVYRIQYPGEFFTETYCETCYKTISFVECIENGGVV